MTTPQPPVRARWTDRLPPSLRPGSVPLRWGLVLAVVGGAILGGGVGYLLGFGDRAVQSGIVGAFVLAAGSRGPLRIALPLGALAGAVVVTSSVLADVTTGHPVAAGLAMAAVAFVTSVAAAAIPLGLLLGMLASYAYVLISSFGVVAAYSRAIELGEGLLVSAVGAVAGLVGILARLQWQDRRHPSARSRPPGGPHPGGTYPGPLLPGAAVSGGGAAGGGPPRPRRSGPSPLAPIGIPLRTFDRHARDGVRRAIALGLAMTVVQWVGDRDAFWVLLAAFVLLLPNGRAPVPYAIARVVGTLVGVLLIVLASLVLPGPAVLALAAVSLLLSIAYAQRSVTIAAALAAAAAAVLVGVPAGDLPGWAMHRFLDTVLGTLIALAAGYLLWPHDPPLESPAPLVPAR